MEEVTEGQAVTQPVSQLHFM